MSNLLQYVFCKPRILHEYWQKIFIRLQNVFNGSILVTFSISAIRKPPSIEKSILAEKLTCPNASIFRFETFLPITLFKTSSTALSISLASTLCSLDIRYLRLLWCSSDFNWIISLWSLIKLLFSVCWDMIKGIR